jgi:hypothetical protein
MSQAGILDVESSNPQIPTSFITDDGTAIPIANELELLGAVVPNAGIPFQSTGAGNVVTYEIQYADETAVSDPTKVGVASFDSSGFDVDANGFVTLTGGGGATTNIDVDAHTAPGTDPVVPNAGNIIMTGAQVAAGTVGTNVIRSNSLAANTVTYEIQRSTAVALSNMSNNGVSHFDSSRFTVDANGFVSINGSGVAETITGDSGGALSPTAGNWDILGQQAGTVPVMDTVGTAPSTLRIEDRTWTTQYVVDPSATVGLRGTYTTIQAAITAAAVSGGNVYIRPGSYTENLTLSNAVNLFGASGQGYMQQTNITGSITFSSVGRSSINNCALFSSTSDGINLSGAGAKTLTVQNCVLTQFAGSGTHYSIVCSASAGIIDINQCQLSTNTNGASFNISDGMVRFNNSILTNSGGNVSTGPTSLNNQISGGTVFFNGSSVIADNVVSTGDGVSISGGTLRALSSYFSGTINTSATGAVILNNCRMYTLTTTCLTVGGSGSSEAYNCEFFSSTASAISISTTLNLSNSVISSSNTNAITGAGTLNYSNLSFTGTSSLINTTTQVPLVASNDAVKVVTPGAYPYTTTPQDGLIKVDTSSARTITPLASPTTGQRHIIKDSVGSAAANNITITPSGKNIDGAASSTININYGSVTIIYDGSQWLIV